MTEQAIAEPTSGSPNRTAVRAVIERSVADGAGGVYLVIYRGETLDARLWFSTAAAAVTDPRGRQFEWTPVAPAIGELRLFTGEVGEW